ncbi:MAG: gfo/Idh/MocA family oxidoreductase [Puniceicoccaceae bacterium]|nr:MAG: gfo/Idh/MocA family oxidoreductase [Puniceicoccaceae bacterium]
MKSKPFMPVPSPVPVTLVGCGAISQLFYSGALAALEAAGEVSVVCLVDPVAANRDALHHLFPNARCETEFRADALTVDDLVIVASPPRFHATQSIAALAAGASVLCEKPMAMNTAECAAMTAAAKAGTGHLAIGLYRRFFPAFEALHEILKTEIYGPLRSFSVREGSAYRWAAASASFSDPASTLGGVFYDVGPHVMDILLWLLGEPSNWTYADDALGGLEVNCVVNLEYKDGLRGSIRLSKDWDLGNAHVFSFERADVIWPVGQAARLRIRPQASAFLFDTELRTPENRAMLNEPQCFTRQILNLIRAMRGEEVVQVTPDAATRSLAFIEDSYARREPMQMAWLTEEEQRIVDSNRKSHAAVLPR